MEIPYNLLFRPNHLQSKHDSLDLSADAEVVAHPPGHPNGLDLQIPRKRWSRRALVDGGPMGEHCMCAQGHLLHALGITEDILLASATWGNVGYLLPQSSDLRAWVQRMNHDTLTRDLLMAVVAVNDSTYFTLSLDGLFVPDTFLPYLEIEKLHEVREAVLQRVLRRLGVNLTFVGDVPSLSDPSLSRSSVYRMHFSG